MKNWFFSIATSLVLAVTFVATPVSASPILPTEFSGLPGDNPALDGFVLGDTQWASSLVFQSFFGQPADRDDPSSAFGPPDIEFFEVGLNQVAVWGFDEPVEQGYVTVRERTNDPASSWPETARILGGTTTGFTFEFIGDIFNLDAQNGYSLGFDLGSPIDAIMVQDISGQAPFAFDVESIGLTSVSHAVPSPAPLALMAAGLMIMASRRKWSPKSLNA